VEVESSPQFHVQFQTQVSGGVCGRDESGAGAVLAGIELDVAGDVEPDCI
jgi:hypothetical protein